MNLLFNSAEVASFSHVLNYLGDNFNFRNEQTISINGIFLENAFSGVSGIWNQISGSISDAVDFSEIIVNGVSFGSGVLRSLGFDSNNDVRQKRYSAAVSVFSSGDLFNLSGTFYSGLSGLQNYRLDLLESLEESLSFSTNEDQTYSYDRNLDIKFLDLSNNNANVQMAKDVAFLVYSSPLLLPFVNAFYPNFYLESGRKYKREVYNLDQGTFSFGERFDFQNENNYIWTYNHALSYSEGKTSVNENGRLKGVVRNGFSSLFSTFNSGISGAYNRCQDIYSVYATTGCGLINEPISKRVSTNKYTEEITYDISFGDDPRNVTGCFWENTISINKVKNDGYVVSENGSVQGRGQKTYNPNQQYLQALGCYSGIKSGVYDRVSGAFFVTGFMDNCASGLFLQSSQFTDSEYDARIEYQFDYTTNNNYNVSGKIDYNELVINDSRPTPTFSQYGILWDKQLVTPVYRGNSSLGNYGNNIVLNGTGTIQDFINHSTGMFISPSGEFFVSELEFTFNPNEKEFAVNLEYSYVNYRAFKNIIV
jgi:hypothetical protein